jgi:hypothetical protein
MNRVYLIEKKDTFEYFNWDLDCWVKNVYDASRFITHLHALRVMHTYPLNKFIKTVNGRIITKNMYETDNIKIETHEF